ncbi:MAG: 50S ribosomal protein L10, partial [Miltoncostaeaceae bacterium]
MRDRDTILAADYRGLSVKEMADFRGRLRDAEARFTVVKNTLARRAAADAERDALLPLLTGPCGLVGADGDAAAAAKALKEFGDEHDGRPAITGGLLDGEEIDVAGIN